LYQFVITKSITTFYEQQEMNSSLTRYYYFKIGAAKERHFEPASCYLKSSLETIRHIAKDDFMNWIFVLRIVIVHKKDLEIRLVSKESAAVKWADDHRSIPCIYASKVEVLLKVGVLQASHKISNSEPRTC
jgi:hypothetical protein